MIKKILASVLVLTLILCSVTLPMVENITNLCGKSISASAKNEEDKILINGDYKYTVLEDGTISISEYIGDDKEITIPDGVTKIGGRAFYCSNLTNITIPKSVTSIGYWAFLGTEWLKSKQKENPLVIINGILIDGEACNGNVIIPDNVISIGDAAFERCDNLTDVTISNSVTNINRFAFSDCDNLKSVTIPTSVMSIGERAFSGTEWLKSKQKENPLVIENSILIDGQTCKGNITIPNGVTSISDSAFNQCTDLISINLPNGVKTIGEDSFSCCPNLKKVNIPNSVTTIKPNAFCACTNLKSITIPSSVTSIGSCAFDNCTTLKCYADSAGEKYAKDNNFKYELVENESKDTNNNRNKENNNTKKAIVIGSFCTVLAAVAIITICKKSK